MTDSLPSLVLIDVFTDGGLVAVEAGQSFLYADDLGAIRDDGVFGTLLVRGGHTCDTDRHEKRFTSLALMLNLPTPDLGQWRAATEVALRELRDRPVEGDAMLRWVYSRGRESTGRLTDYVLTSSAEKVAENRLKPVSVTLVEHDFLLDLDSHVPWALIGAKTLSYAASIATLRYAKSKGLDDVIFTSAEGKLLEGPISTIVVQRGNKLLTPNPGEGVLPGTAQAALFKTATNCGWKVTPTILVPEDLFTTDTVWPVSSVRIAVVVKSIDGEPIR